MTTQIEWGKKEISPPFEFELSSKPNGEGRKEKFDLPNLSSPTLPWELIPFAVVALKKGSEEALAGEAMAVVYGYINEEKPRLAAAIKRTGNHATEVLEFVIEQWVEHSQVDPKA